MKNLTPQFDFDDILIVPKVNTDITSRYKDITLPKILPLFTAPMDTVISLDNINEYINNKINVCLPRTIKYNEFVDFCNKNNINDISNSVYSNVFISLGFADLDKYELNLYQDFHRNAHILIDVANGHMEKIINYCEDIKCHRPDIIIMVGNIANPETYTWYAEHNCVDYIRVGIGNGCFIGNTLIKTNNGYKKISKINVDDLVYTHKNNLQLVKNTKELEYDGDMIKINDNITSTPNHKFCVVNKKYSSIINENNVEIYCEWISASELSKNSEYLLIEM